MPELEVTCSRCESKLHHECYPTTLEEAALDLFIWRPEGGFPKALKKGSYDKDVDDETVPFLTETFLYNLLGKEDARSLMGRIHGLFRALGVEARDFEMKAWKMLDKKKRDHDAEMKRRTENRKRYREHMEPIARSEAEEYTACTYRSFYCFDVNVGACEDGQCFERATNRGDNDFRTERKKPQLGPVVWNGKGLEVRCALCRRVHTATPEQVANWTKEPRYPTRTPKQAEHGFRGPTKPEHWLRARVLFTALGFKDEPKDAHA